MSLIRISDKWSLDRDGVAWKVVEANGKRRIVTWHATILQACQKVINQEAKTADDLAGIIRAIESAEENITQAIIRSGLQTPRLGVQDDLSA